MIARTIWCALVALIVSASAACGASPSTAGGPSGANATPTATVFVATAIPTPRTTPPGTPAPIPSAAIGESAKIKTPPPAANATATPKPEAGIWRIEGYVVDDAGAPLGSACVVIGPVGCQTWSPKTDDRGYYFLDVAAARSTFDVYFEMPGHKTVWWRFIPEGPTEFNVILARG